MLFKTIKIFFKVREDFVQVLQQHGINSSPPERMPMCGDQHIGTTMALYINSNYRKTSVNVVWISIFEWVIVNIYINWFMMKGTFTSMDTKIGSSTLNIWGLKSIH